MVHSWGFARITESLKHQLSQLGWKTSGRRSRVVSVSETWTSIICWKCGNKGRRPTQDYFVCSTCGAKCNADKNGAFNIAGRLITLTSSLHDVRGLGKWASAIAQSSPPKPRGEKSSSRRSSLLSTKGSSSAPRESAAVHHAQTSLAAFGDEASKGDHNPAVVRTMENLAVTGSDASVTTQEE